MGAPRLRVVCDTNTVVSALLFNQGRLAWLRAAWQEGSVIPLVCQATAAELLRVLAYPKFRLSREDQEELLGDFLPYAEVVVLEEAADLPSCRDPHDLVFLQLARCAKADALVTGDEDLLVLREAFTISIRTPAELCAMLNK
jgi:putative PIN family toxin of toxin-antitoxin system